MNYSKQDHRIGLYIRVSTEEQAANPEGSIRNQEDRLRQQVAGWGLGEVKGLYIDRAKSGGNTNRPALQRLLRDIRDKKINLVMVSELSRLSRSVKDFTEIWELMNKMKCGFLSLREKFDTTTAAGEMLIMNLASFSQFERRQVSERVSANFLARAKRGLFNGGTIPIGYKRHPDKKGHLAIDERDVPLIRTCFESYVEKQSLQGTAKHLNKLGLVLPTTRYKAGGHPRDGRFCVGNLSTILRNKAYVGVRVFKEGNGKSEVPACWPPLIEEKLFYQVQNILDRNRQTKMKIQSNGKRFPYVLSSLVYCGSCKDKMVGKSAHGSTTKVAYYEHSSDIKRSSNCKKCTPFRVQAKILEPLVWGKLVELVTQPEFAKDLCVKVQNQQKESPFKSEITSLKAQVSLQKRRQLALTEHLSNIPVGLDAKPFYKQMSDLQDKLKQSQTKLAELSAAQEYRKEALEYSSYARLLKKIAKMLDTEMPPETKAKVARLLLAKIEIFKDHVQIYFNLDASMLESFEFVEKKSLKDIRKSSQPTNLDKLHPKKLSKNIFLEEGSFCLTNGAPGQT